MKISYLLLFFFIALVPFTAVGQITLSDTNFIRVLREKNCNCVDKYGVVNLDSAKKIETIDLRGYQEYDNENIKNIIGIEAFVNLKYLIATNNLIEEVDLSKNIHLKGISLGKNKIKKIDLRKNTNLEYLTINDNLITAIDLSYTPMLNYLNVSSNNLDTINFTNLKYLRYINCSQNNLTHLDMNGQKWLTELQCFKNKLKTIDVTNCDTLLRLVCYSNQLKTINITKNKYLNHLNCMTNQLSAIDVSVSERLGDLFCDTNQLSSLDLRGASIDGRAPISGQRYVGLSCTSNPNLKLVCVRGSGFQIRFWRYDDVTKFSTTCEPAGLASAVAVSQLLLYPNPASDIVHIATPLAIGGSLTITNALGQQVLQQSIIAEATECNIAQLPKGLYSVALRHSNGSIVGQSKLVVQ